ncbi:hypothetical protein RLO149_c005930 [Roseobacter litoralis Och 149]|uniref:Uncharacterized protein n=1 Tax=Roseobacter litoralis (strain ATCC 49566 / DSM 6996 / JCM 21268 / NBRC 15278 / OCh 149) TaxID=391595 RepID=F7ZJZ8_ROSLO|nr:hypothetical protein RLO149_c005930 [Roseobacter litoralis Och 149]
MQKLLTRVNKFAGVEIPLELAVCESAFCAPFELAKRFTVCENAQDRRRTTVVIKQVTFVNSDKPTAHVSGFEALIALSDTEFGRIIFTESHRLKPS